jgi:copper chaperone NosL
MKSSFFAIVLVALLLAAPFAQAQMFQSVPADEAQLLQSGPGKLYCPTCGMNLVKFYKTSHAIGEHQYCSMHCLVDDNKNTTGAQVVDVTSLKFIPVEKAHYVVGSDVKGTMTMTSKYAFASKADAEAFAGKNGGERMTFAAAEAMARKALEKENQMIGKKRSKMAEKGAKIFATMCSDADLPQFSSIAEAKTHLATSGACGQLDDGQYQAVAIYLMSGAGGHAAMGPIQVPEKAKCPVCGMFVAKYPNWVGEIETTDGQHYYFDGVKDMMKFYFDPDRYHVKLASGQIAAIRVSDYYDLGPMDAHKAWYVIGSNVYGPMGDELIPFRTKEEAEIFSKDHFGKSIVNFEKINSDLVHGLDK